MGWNLATLIATLDEGFAVAHFGFYSENPAKRFATPTSDRAGRSCTSTARWKPAGIRDMVSEHLRDDIIDDRVATAFVIENRTAE